MEWQTGVVPIFKRGDLFQLQGDHATHLPRILGTKSNSFMVRVGLRQGLMDRTVVERRASGLGTSGSHLCFLQMMWYFWLLQDLQRALDQFAAESETTGMKVSSSKSKAIVFNRKKVECSPWVGDKSLSVKIRGARGRTQMQTFNKQDLLTKHGTKDAVEPDIKNIKLGSNKQNKTD